MDFFDMTISPIPMRPTSFFDWPPDLKMKPEEYLDNIDYQIPGTLATIE